ncbi:hypothetical protein JMJ77_0014006, partial [Colletotrichum scovillei]
WSKSCLHWASLSLQGSIQQVTSGLLRCTAILLRFELRHPQPEYFTNRYAEVLRCNAGNNA